METQCQDLLRTQRNDLLKLLQLIKEFFDETLGNWEKYPLEFKLKEDAKPICLRPYKVPKVHKTMFKK